MVGNEFATEVANPNPGRAVQWQVPVQCGVPDLLIFYGCRDFLQRLGSAIYDAANDPDGDGQRAISDGNKYLASKLGPGSEIESVLSNCKVLFHQNRYSRTKNLTENNWHVAIPDGVASTERLTSVGISHSQYMLMLGFVTIMGCRYE